MTLNLKITGILAEENRKLIKLVKTNTTTYKDRSSVSDYTSSKEPKTRECDAHIAHFSSS